MTHLRVQSRNDSEHEGTPQTDSLHDDSSVNHNLIAIAQEVAELLKQLIQYKLMPLIIWSQQPGSTLVKALMQ